MPEPTSSAWDEMRESKPSARAGGADLGPEQAGKLLGALQAENDAAAGGDRFGEYTLLGKLGAGAGGVVYRAIRPGSSREVALKVLHARGSDEAGARRVWRELELLESLRLTCVPRVLDYGVERGQMYIATELVRGRSLEQIGPELRADPRRVAEVMARVADAVQTLHEHGIIHRDLKPTNIMMEESGQVLIVDLGLAMLVDRGGMTLTEEGTPIGTPGFMAPEQARGERERFTTRTDVYGLGATAFWVLTGETPHDLKCSLHEAVRRVAQEAGRGVREVRPGLAKGLAAVVGKACEAMVERRYESAGAMGEDLKRWGRGERVTAQSSGYWRRVTRWAGRRPILATAVMSALLAGAIVGTAFGTAWWMSAVPDRLVVEDDDRTRVAIVSKFGRTLHVWQGAVRESFTRDALLLDDPRKNGQRLVALGLSEAAGIEGAGEIGVYTFTSSPGLVWRSGTSPPQIQLPRPTAWERPEEFRVHVLIAGDVFPEVAGSEIVASHRHVLYSATAIRVYSMVSGEVLYEAWHDGTVDDLAWLAPEGLLLVTARNSEVDGRDRVREPKLTKHPTVVFALRPVLRPLPGWIETPSWTGSVKPAWYFAILPAARAPGEPPLPEWDHAEALPRTVDNCRQGIIQVSGGAFGQSLRQGVRSAIHITLRTRDGTLLRIDPSDEARREYGLERAKSVEVTALPPWVDKPKFVSPR